MPKPRGSDREAAKDYLAKFMEARNARASSEALKFLANSGVVCNRDTRYDLALSPLSNPHFFGYEIRKLVETDSGWFFLVRIYEEYTGSGIVNHYDESGLLIDVGDNTYLLEDIARGDHLNREDARKPLPFPTQIKQFLQCRAEPQGTNWHRFKSGDRPRLVVTPEDGPFDGHIVLLDFDSDAGALRLAALAKYGPSGCGGNAKFVDFDGDGVDEIIVRRSTGIGLHMNLWVAKVGRNDLQIVANGLFCGEVLNWKPRMGGGQLLLLSGNLLRPTPLEWGLETQSLSLVGGVFKQVDLYREVPVSVWSNDERVEDILTDWYSEGGAAEFGIHRLLTGVAPPTVEAAMKWWRENREKFREGDIYAFR